MVTGQQPFKGDYDKAIMYSILNEEPEPMTGLRTGVPMELERIAGKCSSKPAEDRYHTASDLIVDVRKLAEAVAESESGKSRVSIVAQPAPAAAQAGGNWLPWAVALAMVAVAGWQFVGGSAESGLTASGEVRRFHVEPPPEGTGVNYLSVSPDGRYFAYEWIGSSGPELWIHDLQENSRKLIEGPDNPETPFWSPDSKHLAFFEAFDGTLSGLDIESGVIQTICRVPGPTTRGGFWGEDDKLLFSVVEESVGGIYEVPAGGGEPVKVLGPTEAGLPKWPVKTPGGGLLFTRQSDSLVRLLVPGASDESESFLTGSFLSYAPQGFLLYVREGSVMARRFDSDAMNVGENALSVVAGKVDFNPGAEHASLGVSHNGTLVYRSSDDVAQLTWVDRATRRKSVVGEPRAYRNPFRLSPNQQQIAVIVLGEDGSDLWLLDETGAPSARFPHRSGRRYFDPAWSPDGLELAFSVDGNEASGGAGGPPPLFRGEISNPSGARPVLPQSSSQFATDWSRSGRYVLLAVIGAGTGYDLKVVEADNIVEPVPYLATPNLEFRGRFSPDGRWIAYISDESGAREVHVRGFDPDNPGSPGEAARQISTRGGDWVSWRADGREIYYRRADGLLMAVPLIDGDPMRPGRSEELFEIPDRAYDVSNDGERFLVAYPLESRPDPFTVILNWPALLDE